MDVLSDGKEVPKYDKDKGFLYIHKDKNLEIKMKLKDLGEVYEFENRYIELSDVG